MTGVRLIRFEIVTKRRGKVVVEFHREDKIADLLGDDGSLGEFLREMLQPPGQEPK